MELFHDSRDPAFRSPGGAQPCGAEVTLRLRVAGGAPDQVLLRVWFGKESFYPMKPSLRGAGCYEATLNLPGEPCLLWYDFQVWANGQFHWYGNAEDGLGGVGAPIWGHPRSYQITVYSPGFQTPAWTRGAVFYQIFPDRFCRGSGPVPPLPAGRRLHKAWSERPLLEIDPENGDNVAHDFFGGTLSGIREKLAYIASLGVTALYVNPIFFARTNHRFDTTDWRRIDPLLGTEADFIALCEQAESMGIQIVLDGVFSHSGSANPFFQEALQNADSPYRHWYQFEHWPDMYKSWWGFATLPDLNKNHPEVLDYFLCGPDAIVKKWIREGMNGWRIDVADELPMQYLAQLRQGVKEARADAIVIGEVWEDASNKISYGQMRCYCLGDTLDGVMNYPLRDAAIGFLTGTMDAFAFKRRMDSLYENYPEPFARALLNVLGTHDRPRILNVLAGEDGESLPREERGALKLTGAQRSLGKRRLLLMLSLFVAMPGMPCIYYGDEAGMEGAADPYNRATFPWGGEDTEITALYREAMQRKRSVAVLTEGAMEIEAIGPDVLAVIRKAGGCVALTAINRADCDHAVTVLGSRVELPPYGAVFRVMEQTST